MVSQMVPGGFEIIENVSIAENCTCYTNSKSMLNTDDFVKASGLSWRQSISQLRFKAVQGSLTKRESNFERGTL